MAFYRCVSTSRLLSAFVLGFAAGVPLLLTGQVLVAWMAMEGVGLKTASAFAAVALPYTFKWAWAPVFDVVEWPWLGRRRGWIVVLEIALAVAIVALGAVGMGADVEVVAALAVVVAFVSASHDVVVDAWLAESLGPDERAAGSAAYVMGYRGAMLVIGGGGFMAAKYVGWEAVYGAAAVLTCAGCVAVAIMPEPVAERRDAPVWRTIAGAVWELVERPGVVAVVMAVAMFRFGEMLVLHVQALFALREMKIDVVTYGWVTQVAGFAGIAAGGTVLATWAPRLGPRHALYIFGATAAAANLGWALLAAAGAPVPLFAAVAFVDALGTSMASGAFVAFLMGLCTPGRAATQYALLNALSSVAARVFGFVTAPLVATLGWAGFFAATALMMVPALAAFAMVPRARFEGVASSTQPT
jgi:MFS transporter, PAT family, beta-lactamase induction signal transducer AmpG